MGKSSDLEIIKQLEKELGKTLEKVELGKLEERMRRKKFLMAFVLYEKGRVKGLGLDELRLSKPQVKLNKLNKGTGENLRFGSSYLIIYTLTGTVPVPIFSAVQKIS